jgi:hypothetical protein
MKLDFYALAHNVTNARQSQSDTNQIEENKFTFR